MPSSDCKVKASTSHFSSHYQLGGAVACQRDSQPSSIAVINHRSSHTQCKDAVKPPFFQVRQHLGWWEKHAPEHVLKLILGGGGTQFSRLGTLVHPHSKITEGNAIGFGSHVRLRAAGGSKRGSLGGNKFFSSLVCNRKKTTETGKKKLRLISDCRKINQYVNPKTFKLNQ